MNFNMETNKNILITGASGLVGSRIKTILESTYKVSTISLDMGIDITDVDSVEEVFRKTKYDFVLHLAAKADVDACELDKNLGKKGPAWIINVIGTENLVRMCSKYKSKLIYISTDFILDGKKEGQYYEDDNPNPINWYAKTKYAGEVVIKNNLEDYIIARIAYPYRENFDLKLDFARAIIKKLRENQEISVVSDQYFTPTFIDDIGSALDKLISLDARGIYHIVGSECLTPFDAALTIQKLLGLENLVKKTTRKDFFNKRAVRPYNLNMNNDKITKLGVRMLTFSNGIKKLI
jgi:dTDP-4-dehydrorhamnose reductase